MNSDVLVYTGGNYEIPVGIVTTSEGDIYIAITDESPSYIALYKSINNGANWSLVASSLVENVFPSGTYIAEAHIAIDDNDIIHIVAGTNDAYSAIREIAYCAFNTSIDTFGTWETVYQNPTDIMAHIPICSISIDANNKPHIFFSYQYSHLSGNHVLSYSNRVSGSWSASEDIDPIPNYVQYQYIQGIVKDIDNMEVLFQIYNPYVSSRTKTSGAWGARTEVDVYPSAILKSNALIINSSDSAHRYSMDYGIHSEKLIYEDGIDTTLVGNGLGDGGAHFVDITYRIIFTEDDGYFYISKSTGSGWSTPEQVSAIIGYGIKLEYSYRYDNQIDRINFAFYNVDHDIYFNYCDISEPAPPSVSAYGPLVWTT